MPLNKYARTAVLVIMAVCVLVPFTLLVLRTFAYTWFFPNMFPDLSLQNIKAYIDSGTIQKPLVNSITLSALVTLISAAIGILPAKYFGTRNFRYKIALYIFLLIPAVTPGICIMFGLIEALIKMGIYRYYLSMVFCQVAFTTPYFIFTMIPVFKRYDTSLDDQSAILGVGKFSTLLNVTLPAVKTGLATSMMLTFVISWSMYLITSVSAPRGFSTMATVLLPQLSFGYAMDSYVAVTAFIFMIPAIISLVLSTIVIGSDRNNARRAR